MKILNWNIEWAGIRSKRWHIIKDIIDSIQPNIICLTEAPNNICFKGYYWIEANAEYGYGEHAHKRKVILGSSEEWQNASTGSDLEIPPGRFIKGRTQGVDIHGVCIPWRDSNVRTGRKDRKIWQDHLQYIKGIKDLLPQENTILLGDFNQRIPKAKQPQYCYEALTELLREFQVPTSQIETSNGGQHIDHIVLSTDFQIDSTVTLPKLLNGTRLSDHDGVLVTARNGH